MEPWERMWFDLVFWVLTTIFIAMRFYHVLRYLPTTRTQPQSIALATIGVAYLLGTIILFLDFGMQCRLMRAKDAGEEMMAEVGAPLRLAEPLLKALNFQIVGYLATIWLVKISLIAVFYDIAPRMSNLLRWTLHTAFALTGLTGAFVILSYIGWCQPFETLWKITQVNYCSPLTAIEYAATKSAFHLFTDALVFAIPIFLINKLSLQRKEILSILFVFFVGCTTIAVAIVRLVLQVNYINSNLAFAGRIPPPASLWLCCVAEFATGIVCACLPSARAIFRKHRESTRIRKSTENLTKEDYLAKSFA